MVLFKGLYSYPIYYLRMLLQQIASQYDLVPQSDVADTRQSYKLCKTVDVDWRTHTIPPPLPSLLNISHVLERPALVATCERSLTLAR